MKTRVSRKYFVNDCSLFRSMIADGKKVFLKMLCLILISGIPSTFPVA